MLSMSIDEVGIGHFKIEIKNNINFKFAPSSLPKEKRSDHSTKEIVKQIGKIYRVEALLRAKSAHSEPH